MQIITIKQNDVGQRLDSFLKKTFPKLSLSSMYRFIRTKRIKLNGKKAEISTKLILNDKLELYVNDGLLSKKILNDDFLIANSKLNVVFEDNNVIIINKPAGLVVHDDESKTTNTLVNILKHYLYEKNEWDYKNENSFIPSLVNRIDRNTRGIVLAAKNAESLRILSLKMKNREIDKYYLCQVYGIIDPKNGTLHDYLTRNTKTKMVLVTKKPVSSESDEIITEYRTFSHDANTSWLEIKLITGKTHQIRAHMAYIGHPLVGEQKYTTSRYSAINDEKHQQLISYKIIFNFRSDAGILNYLNRKIFEIKP